MKNLKFVRSWRHWAPGQIVQRDDGVADLMIRRGICVETGADVQPPPPLEAAASRTAAASRPTRRRK